MTQPRLNIIGAFLISGLATALVIQHQALLKLRADNEVQRRQCTELGQLAAENERLSNLVAEADRPLPATTEPSKELLRLRGEVGVLRQQNQGLARMLLSKQEATSAPGEDRGFEPSAAWADAGNATPESAAQTFCWAIKAGNVNRLAEVLMQPDHTDKDPSTLVSELSTGLEPLLSQIEASRFLAADNTAADETTLWFQNRLKGGETLISPLALKRVDNEWKVKLSLGQ